MNKLTILLLLFVFILGELSGQSINIAFPTDGHTFAVGKRPKVTFTSPSDAPEGAQFEYELRVCRIEEGQTKAQAIMDNDPYFLKNIGPLVSINQQPVELPYFTTDQLQSQFAYQVHAEIVKDGDTTYATSNIQSFYSPLRVLFIYVGNVLMTMDTGSTDINNYWGIGNLKALFEDNLDDVKRVEVEGLKLSYSYGYHYLEGGHIIVDTAIDYSISSWINPNLPDFRFTSDSFLLNANTTWIYNQGAKINVAEDFENIDDLDLLFEGRTGYIRFQGPFSPMRLGDTQNVAFSEANMIMSILPETSIFLNDLKYTLTYDLEFRHQMLKTTADTTSMVFKWTAESNGQSHNYLEVDDFMSDTLAFSEAMQADLILGHRGHKGAVIDLSDTISPYALPDDWNGIYFRDGMLRYRDRETQHKVLNILVHSNGIDATLSHGLEDSLVLASIPFSHSFHHVHYSLKNSTLADGSRLIGNVDAALIADSTRSMFISLENDKMSYPYVIRSEGDTIHFTPPYGQPTTRITDKTAMINWIGMGAGYTYEVDLSTDTFKTFVPGYKAKMLTDHTALLVGLESETDYQYRVRAYQGDEFVSQSSSDILLTFRTEPIILGQKESAQIYPNPASDRLNIKLNSPSNRTLVKLMDLSGKVYLNTELQTSNLNNIHLDVANYPSGIYFLKVGENGSSTKVFIE